MKGAGNCTELACAKRKEAESSQDLEEEFYKEIVE